MSDSTPLDVPVNVGAPPVAGGPPAPGQTPPPPAAAVQVTGDITAQANREYQVVADGGTGVSITLPATVADGQTVRVSGVGTSAWSLVPNAGQAIETIGVAGNVAPGTDWTPHLAPESWHWVATNPTGNVLVAGSIFGTGNATGNLYVSRDGGQNWTLSNTNGSWISADMNASGERMFAVSYDGGMFRSIDGGLSWDPVNSDIPNISFSGREWESVTMSQIGAGLRVAAAIKDGPLVVSDSGGNSWREATSLVPGFANAAWRALDSSADGSVVVAASQSGSAWISNNTFGEFMPLVVVLADGTVVNDTWYRAAISANGNTIVLAGNEQYPSPRTASTGLYVSHDRGQSWTRASSITGNYTSVTVSADGSVIGATLSGGNGQALLSRDRGATFTPITPSGTPETMWRNMALSADGNSMVLAAGTFIGAPGQLYTSMGNRTSYGVLGSLGGGQNQSVEVRYNAETGRFTVTNSAGGPFTIR